MHHNHSAQHITQTVPATLSPSKNDTTRPRHEVQYPSNTVDLSMTLNSCMHLSYYTITLLLPTKQDECLRCSPNVCRPCPFRDDEFVVGVSSPDEMMALTQELESLVVR